MPARQKSQFTPAQKTSNKKIILPFYLLPQNTEQSSNKIHFLFCLTLILDIVGSKSNKFLCVINFSFTSYLVKCAIKILITSVKVARLWNDVPCILLSRQTAFYALPMNKYRKHLLLTTIYRCGMKMLKKLSLLCYDFIN